MLARLRQRYHSLFSIREIEESIHLKLAFGAILLSFFATFFRGWASNPILTVEAYHTNTFVCWPYFQDCGRFYFLHLPPYGYSQPVLYVCLLAIMMLIVYRIYRADWVHAHIGLSLLLLFKIVASFGFSSILAQNFDYFDMLFGAILLFVPYKLFYLRIMFVVLYFISATLKFDEGWVLGTYFTSLSTGLPIFAKSMVPLATNLVIFMEVIGSWLLLSRNQLLQRSAFAFFLLFHLYSTIIINYRFPLIAIPMLVILFGIDFSLPRIRLYKGMLAGAFIIIAFIGLQSIRFFIPGDANMTLEGHRLGIYLFDANHQCISTMTETFQTGKTETVATENAVANSRCDPYVSYFHIKQLCMRDHTIARIAWTFDHSVDGGPFYRIVDVPDACALSYSPFAHNPWIKLPSDGPAIIGYPIENIYSS